MTMSLTTWTTFVIGEYLDARTRNTALPVSHLSILRCVIFTARLNALRRGDPNQNLSKSGDPEQQDEFLDDDVDGNVTVSREFEKSDRKTAAKQKRGIPDDLFSHPELVPEQVLVDAIIDAIFYYEADRERIRKDPLVRLLIPNPDGNYHFAIVTAMGVITEGKKGLELEAAFRRIKKKRDVEVIRADTGTARSYDYNAAKIEEAIESATKMKRPYGLLGYSQGCANALNTESLLLSGMSACRTFFRSCDGMFTSYFSS